MEALLERQTDTEPLPAVDSGKRCGVDGCRKPAPFSVWCQMCLTPLCTEHVDYRKKSDDWIVVCPGCKGGK